MTKQEKTWVWLSGLAALIIMFALLAAVGRNDPNSKTIVISVQGEATESMTLAAAPPTATLSSRTATLSPSATTATTPTASKAPAPVVTTHSPTAAPTTPPVAPTSAAPATTAQTTRAAAPTTTQAPDTCGGPTNPDGYTLCPGGSLIYSPDSNVCDYFNCIDNFQYGKGYMVECNDGTYSMSGGRRGDCSDHGGEQQAVYSS